MMDLDELFNYSGTVLTAHRGASFEFPENTIPAFEAAIKAHTHFIEFDLYVSKDGVPVVLHDKTIDRTSNGSGRPEELTLTELKSYNYSYFHHGERHDEPMYEVCEIPTFEEVLQKFSGKVCMNIQLNGKPDENGIKEICRLYKKYNMEKTGYLTIAWQDTFQATRDYASDIEICFTPPMRERATPESLALCKSLNCRYVQPVRAYFSAETAELCQKLNLRDNIFYSDDPAEAQGLIAMGAKGIMTNKIELLAKALL